MLYWMLQANHLKEMEKATEPVYWLLALFRSRLQVPPLAKKVYKMISVYHRAHFELKFLITERNQLSDPIKKLFEQYSPGLLTHPLLYLEKICFFSSLV